MCISRFHKGPRMSQGVSWNGMFFTSAQVAKDLDLDAARQTQEVLEKIDSLLAERGFDKSNVISATIWLADVTDYAAMNSIWETWVCADAPPARACVEARFSSPRIKVEIQIIAAG